MKREDCDVMTQREAQEIARLWIDSRVEKPPDRSGYSQTRSLMIELGNQCIAEALRNKESDEGLRERLSAAWDVLYSLRYEAGPECLARRMWKRDDDLEDDERRKKIEAARHIVWLRRDPKRSLDEGYESDQFIQFSADLLQTIASYLERPWLRHAVIDWIILDMLVTDALCTFGEELKEKFMPGERTVLDMHPDYHRAKGNVAKMKKAFQDDRKELFGQHVRKVSLSLGLPVAMILAAFYLDYFRTGWIFVGVYSVVVFVYLLVAVSRWGGRAVQRALGRQEPHIKWFALWNEMYEVWRLLSGPVVNPKRVREAMARSTEHGAVWNEAAWSVIDRVVAIDPAIWVIRPSRS